MPKLCVQYDDSEYQILKLAAAIDDSQSLKAWATRKLLAQARQIVTDYQTQAAEHIQAIHAGRPVKDTP